MTRQTEALLISRLYVPIVIREILESPADLRDDMQYSLHTVLSDYRPDSALLAIALCAREIMNFVGAPSSQDQILNTACVRIVDEYGAFWVAHFDDREAGEALLLDILEDVAEDLGTLSDLLTVVQASVSDSKAQALLQILQVQAQAHNTIADEFVNLMDCEFMQGEREALQFQAQDSVQNEPAFSTLDLDIAGYGLPSDVLEFPVEV